jgi:hypothetical protein
VADTMRVMLDRLDQATRARRAAAGATAPAGTPAPLASGLRFQPGETVLDLASGRRGTVVAGVRDDVAGSQFYTVDLITGATVIRLGIELERATSPGALAAGR